MQNTMQISCFLEVNMQIPENDSFAIYRAVLQHSDNVKELNQQQLGVVKAALDQVAQKVFSKEMAIKAAPDAPMLLSIELISSQKPGGYFARMYEKVSDYLGFTIKPEDLVKQAELLKNEEAIMTEMEFGDTSLMILEKTQYLGELQEKVTALEENIKSSKDKIKTLEKQINSLNEIYKDPYFIGASQRIEEGFKEALDVLKDSESHIMANKILKDLQKDIEQYLPPLINHYKGDVREPVKNLKDKFDNWMTEIHNCSRPSDLEKKLREINKNSDPYFKEMKEKFFDAKILLLNHEIQQQKELDEDKETIDTQIVSIKKEIEALQKEEQELKSYREQLKTDTTKQ